MALLKAKREINKLKNQHNNSSLSIVKALPNELLVEIMGKVASNSMGDLCRMKLSCKEILNASEDGYVYQHASMENFALVPLPWFKEEKETTFLKRCRENGNLEILYREGMVQYFSSSMVDLGFENLKKGALKGHHEAKYVYSMLLIGNFDEEKRKLGCDSFRELKNSTCVVKCRKRVKSFVQSMWVKDCVVPKKRFCLCCYGTCGTEKKVQKDSTWPVDESVNDDVSCEYCEGDCEFDLFCNMFRRPILL